MPHAITLETQLATPSVAVHLRALFRPTLKSHEWARLRPRTKGDWRDSHPSPQAGKNAEMDVVSRLFSWARFARHETAPPDRNR